MQTQNKFNSLILRIIKLANMICIIVFFLMFLSITTKSDIINGQPSQILEYVTVTKSKNDDYAYDVRIEDSEIIQIFMYRSKSQENGIIDKLYAFYIALNCKFADWAISNIYYFILRSPLFHQYRDPSNAYVIVDSSTQFDFESLLTTFIASMKEDVERIVRILINFMDTHSNVSYYNDASILEALELFRIKLNYVSLNSSIPDGMDTPVLNILRLFMKDMNAFQRILLKNCPGLLTNGVHPVFQSYWITDLDNVQRPYNIYSFFLNTSNIQLMLCKQTNCSCKEIFLEKFVEPPTDDDISLDIKRSVVIIDNCIEYELKYLIDDIKVSYDVELILRYQEAIAARIMSLLFIKVINVVMDRALPITIVNTIMSINRIISKKHNEMPTPLVDGFNILKNIFTSDNPVVDDLRKFYESVTMFNIFSESKIDNKWNDIEYLKKILERINDNISDIKCFHRTYQRLHHQYNKTYGVPYTLRKLISIPSTIHISEAKIKTYQRSCSFAKNLYSLCFKALMLVYQSFVTPESSDKIIYKNHSLDVLFHVRKYFYIIINYHLNNGDLLKFAHSITPILVNVLRTFNDDLEIYEILRVLNIILVDVKVAVLNHCMFSNTNYLAFHNIDMFDFVSLEDLDKSFVEFVQLSRDFDLDRLTNNDDSVLQSGLYYDLDILHNTVFINSKVYKSYGRIVRFVWKGKVQSVIDIYNDVSALILNSPYFFAVYDIVYKFYIAVVYYEILKVFRIHFSLKTVLAYFDQLLNIFVNFVPFTFPDALKPLVLKINLLLNVKKHGDSAGIVFMNMKEEIDEEFEKYNVRFVEHSLSSTESGHSNITMKFSSEDLIDIKNELHYVLEYFKSFKDLFILTP